MTDYVALSYAVVILLLVLVALYALAYPTVIAPRFFKAESGALQDLEGFLTAKKSQSRWRIAFSFYAGSVGAWAITTPASYATFAGWVGMVFYAIACGLPIVILAFFGNVVRDRYPTAGALGDIIVIRFGPAMRLCTCVVALFNMAIFMLAEFTTIGSLFQDFVGSINYPIIIVMAVLTTCYSAYGGLLVSIVTDQIQAAVSLLFLVVLSIYVWATFKQPLPAGFGDLAPLLGPNESGYGAIFVMPVSLMAATIFNEGMWQRVWAAEDEKALKQGGIIGGITVVVAIFLYGLFGFIAAWGGLINFETTNPNLYLFQVFKSSPDQEANSVVDTGIEVLTLVLALVMSESAIDSLQNGISATISTTFLRGYDMMYARGVVLAINIVIVPFALANYSVLSLFLTANMLGCAWFLPLMIGVLWDAPLGRKIFSETTSVLGACSAIILVTIYGIVDGPKQCAKLANVGAIFPPYHDICQCATLEQIGQLDLEITGLVNCAKAGASWAWLAQPYMWEYFLFITFVSLGLTLFYGAINMLLPDTAPGITDMLGLGSQRKQAPEADEGKKAVPMTDAVPPLMTVPPLMMTMPYAGYPPGMMPPMQPMTPVYGGGMPMNVAMPQPGMYPGMMQQPYGQPMQWGSA